jgi:hypothetical protein
MNRKSKIIVWSAVPIIVFLLGFAPQYFQKRQLETSVKALQNDVALAELRDLSTLAMLETLKRNYGTAGTYASQYFDKLRQAAADEQNASKRAAFDELLMKRDTVTAALAQDDVSSLSQIQSLAERTFEVTRNPLSEKPLERE